MPVCDSKRLAKARQYVKSLIGRLQLDSFELSYEQYEVQFVQVDMGPPLHSLVVCGQLHEIEEKMLALWKV